MRAANARHDRSTSLPQVFPPYQVPTKLVTRLGHSFLGLKTKDVFSWEGVKWMAKPALLHKSSLKNRSIDGPFPRPIIWHVVCDKQHF